MCGIVAIKHLKGHNVSRAVRKQYARQKRRGMDGYGFVAVHENGVQVMRERSEPFIMKALKETVCSEIIFHHRLPTSTPNIEHLNHPIFVSHPDFEFSYLFVHNGIVYNPSERRKAHEGDGFVYTTNYEYASTIKPEDTIRTENDTEALAIDVAQFVEGDRSKIKARGHHAFVMLQITKDGKPVALHFGRNANPLHFYADPERFMLSSEGAGSDIEPNRLYTLNYETREIEYVELEFPRYGTTEFYRKGTHTHNAEGQNEYRYSQYEEDDRDLPPENPRILPPPRSADQFILPEGELYTGDGTIDQAIAHMRIRDIDADLETYQPLLQVYVADGDKANAHETQRLIDALMWERDDLVSQYGSPSQYPLGFSLRE